MDLTQLDSNFKIKAMITEKDCKFYSPWQQPMRVYGLLKSGEQGFKRLPDEVAKAANPGVEWLHRDTSGGRVRFCTDSRYVAISVKMPYLIMPHMPLSGSAGFDLYADGKYYKSFIPPIDYGEGYQGILYFPRRKLRSITLYFPLYCHVHSLSIGIEQKAALSPSPEYTRKRPVVYYGGSHVQGGCASNPGASAPALISRWSDGDFINLGFSGSALGEQSIARYIGGIDMDAFVMEYDHNAPTPQHLQATHYPFYRTVRDLNPDVPIIMISKHDYYTCSYYVKSQQENVQRRRIIMQSYDKARLEGDKNVYFIDGKTVLGGADRDSCTVDGVHPNNLGFYRMAKKLYSVLKPLI